MRRFLSGGLAAVLLVGLLMALPGVSDAQPVPPATALQPAAVVPAPAIQLVDVARPAAVPVVHYVVVAGDTLWAIGLRFGVGWPALAAVNRLADPDLIMVGQVLVIADAATAPVSPQRPVYAPQRSQTPTPSQTYHQPAPVAVAASAPSGGVWGCIAQHESGGNPATNTGNGYYGLYQDTLGSWQAAGGGPGLPSDYSAAEQTAVNQRIQQQQGWGAWPVTSRMCGA